MKKQIVSYMLVALLGGMLATVLQPLQYPSHYLSHYLSQYLQAASALAGTTTQGNCQDFKETGKRVCGRFLEYWQKSGGLPQQGYPISNEFTERSDLDGKDYTVQYFERAVFEKHPENQPPYDVLLSQLGTYRYRQKYPNGEPGAPTPTPPPPVYKVGDKAIIREGVTITLVADSTKMHEGCFGGVRMDWNFMIENTSKVPHTMKVDPGSVRMSDSNGKSYEVHNKCAGIPGISGAFSGDSITIPANGGKARARAMFTIENMAATTKYLDMQVQVENTTYTFRYPIQ